MAQHSAFSDAETTGPAAQDSAARRSLSIFQLSSLVVLIGATASGLAVNTSGTLSILALIGIGGFLVSAIWRLVLLLLSRPPEQPATAEPDEWPRYTVIAALYREATVVGQLIERLSRIDYPADRLEGFIALEQDDLATLEAALATPRPDWLQILVCPPGEPRTKPRALNHALTLSTGELVTVYDAEDEPHPGQLREAALRFMANREAGGRLVCLQAPLRIRPPASHSGSRFVDRQFALEYAALFEVLLPAYARLGMPFPLGGTSNHFRVDVLRRLGGWDPWNVTEDADLGFRLWADGGRLGVIASPTMESPPGGLEHWLPQRTRWLKGYMQTFGVHTRRPWRLGVMGIFALFATLGQALAAAAVHGVSLGWVTIALMLSVIEGISPMTPLGPMLVLVSGAATAWVAVVIGAGRAGFPIRFTDLASSPAYWSMLSLALAHATWRLIRQPSYWDKTEHKPDARPDKTDMAEAA